MAAYRGVLDHAGSLTDLVGSARTIFTEDLDAGHVTVLVEMIAGARSVPGLGEQVAAGRHVFALRVTEGTVTDPGDAFLAVDVGP